MSKVLFIAVSLIASTFISPSANAKNQRMIRCNFYSAKSVKLPFWILTARAPQFKTSDTFSDEHYFQNVTLRGPEKNDRQILSPSISKPEGNATQLYFTSYVREGYVLSLDISFLSAPLKKEFNSGVLVDGFYYSGTCKYLMSK